MTAIILFFLLVGLAIVIPCIWKWDDVPIIPMILFAICLFLIPLGLLKGLDFLSPRVFARSPKGSMAIKGNGLRTV